MTSCRTDARPTSGRGGALVDERALRPVVCLTDHLYRDLAIGQAAVRGRFVHHGLELDLGRHPDWLRAGHPDDEEWRIEWVKLYEGLHLAHAFATTGDPAMLDTWQDLVESFCAQVPIDHDPTDVTARRVQNWLYAWQAFAAVPQFPGLRPGLTERLVARISADADHVAANLTPERNHRTLELYTLLLVALALDEPTDRVQAALQAITENAVTDIWSDGVHRECSTDYHCIVLRSLLGGVANARRANLAVPDALLERVGAACDFALHVQRPDGTTPALSDGDEGDYRHLLAVAADLLARPELDWVATAGRRGTPPARRMVSFPVGGYHVQRSGWGDRGRPYELERWAVLDCGPIGDGGHGHYDQLSVELMAAGHRLVVDPGRYTYAEDAAGWRRRFKGTAAHNTVTVDDLDQTPYRPGKPKGPTSTAELLGRSSTAGLDLLRGSVRSPAHDAVHVRTLALVDDDFWVVHDRLTSPTPHAYTARWHLPPSALGRTEVRADADQVTVAVPGGHLVVPVGLGVVGQEAGFVSPTYGIRLPAPVVTVTRSGQAADLLTVVLPVEPGQDGDVRVRAACAADRVEVTVDRAAGRHRVWWSTDEPASGWEHRPW